MSDLADAILTGADDDPGAELLNEIVDSPRHDEEVPIRRGAIHPGAALFSEEARRKVAEGPLFVDETNPAPEYGIRKRESDECCVLGALLKAEGLIPPADEDFYRILPASDAYQLLVAHGRPAPDEEELQDLIDNNDHGDYAARANLRRDLLGE